MRRTIELVRENGKWTATEIGSACHGSGRSPAAAVGDLAMVMQERYDILSEVHDHLSENPARQLQALTTWFEEA